jgi:hypothetical protein
MVTRLLRIPIRCLVILFLRRKDLTWTGGSSKAISLSSALLSLSAWVKLEEWVLVLYSSTPWEKVPEASNPVSSARHKAGFFFVDAEKYES